MSGSSTHFSLICEMAYTGTWTGHVIELIDADLAADGSVAGTNDYFIYARAAADNTCGSLHVREHVTNDPPPDGSARAVGTILAGTGDWAGSTGTAFISGTVLGGAGIGGYSGSWERPLPRTAPSSVPCLPPTPGVPLDR
ncbi:MAG: hypothetical protein QOE35_3561 [Actinomycetota bacterium]